MNNKIFNISIGLAIIFFSGFSVFGNVFDRLRAEHTAGASIIDTSEEVTVEAPVQSNQDSAKSVSNQTNVSQNSTSSNQNNVNTSVNTSTTTTVNINPSGYTLAQVSSHDSASSCWSAINGGVYDLTAWVNRHPGGKASILMICGKDGSGLYSMQHGRSNKVASILKDYKIGDLI